MNTKKYGVLKRKNLVR